MNVIDLNAHEHGSRLTADVCVIGSGPAGSTIARELAGTGLDVLVLESGGVDREEYSDRLADIVAVGQPRVSDSWAVHNRVLGGTSTTWSGRLATFDDMDFRERSWVSSSGWPLARSALAPYLERSRNHLGAPLSDNQSPQVQGRLRSTFSGGDRSLFRPYGWTYSRDVLDPGDHMRFGPRALKEELAGVRVLVHATVTDLGLSSRSGATLEVRDRVGGVHSVVARHTVLAAGAIENARLLLVSERRAPGHLGDTVGRFLMDHLRGPVARWEDRQSSAVQRLFGGVIMKSSSGGVEVTPGLAITGEVQEREKLLNCALFLSGDISSDDPMRALRALTRRQEPVRNGVRVLRAPLLVAESAARIIRGRSSELRRMHDLELHVIVEQAPDRWSRIRLSDSLDSLGNPLPEVDWRFGEMEARTARWAARTFVAEAERLGWPVPVLTPMAASDEVSFHMPDVAHPTGTTRMSVTPEDGVVDTDCAVHGAAGLYVAGSSVFPTSGHANPTQMIVALAVRLADHLHSLVRNS